MDHLFEIVNGLMSSPSGYISSLVAPLFSSVFKLELPSWEAFHRSASAVLRDSLSFPLSKWIWAVL